MKEFVLPPFSFREYLAYHLDYETKRAQWESNAFTLPSEAKQTRVHTLDVATETTNISASLQKLREARLAFAGNVDLRQLYMSTKGAYAELASGSKTSINTYLRQFVIDSGFPRVWNEGESFLYRQKFLWEQHVGKVLYVDLVEAVHIRKPKELERLFTFLVDLNGKECTLPQLKERLGIKSQITLDRYINYLRDLALVYRLDKTKSPRVAEKRRSGLVKFYLTDVALRHAFFKRDVDVFDDAHEIGGIAENLVCVALENFLLLGPTTSDSLGYYRDKGREEVDFIVKMGAHVLPIEVKYRNDIANLQALDGLCAQWKLTQSIVVTKDFDMTYRDGRLSVPLWFFLLIF